MQQLVRIIIFACLLGSVPYLSANAFSLLHASSITFHNGVTDENRGTWSGPVVIQGSIPAMQAGKLYLWETFGKTPLLLDSAMMQGGKFNFAQRDLEVGIYMIGFSEGNMCPIIVNPREKTVDVQFTSSRLETGLKSATSAENQGWAQYIQKEPSLLKAIKDAKVGAAKNPQQKASFDQMLATQEAALLQLQGDLIAQFPGTYLAKLLTWKQEPERTDIQKYWNNIDFSDPSVIRCRVLSDRIESFMRSFSQGKDAGFIQCVQIVAEAAKADERVLEFVLNQMLTGFYESNMETICAFIIDNYVHGDSCGDADLSNVIKSTAESIQRLSLGNTPPNIQLTGNSGQAVDLYALAAANKYTLVMFWSSFCEHCKGEAPEVKACYDQWHSKGLEILGVSIDRNQTAWETAIQERGFTFPNVCGMKEYQSPVAKDYRISRTPTFFLLDANKKIVLKPKGIREVQAFLKQKGWK